MRRNFPVTGNRCVFMNFSPEVKKEIEQSIKDIYEFDDEALRVIAKKAKEKKMGARALRAIIEEFMLDIMYEIPKDDNIGKVTITREYIEGTGGPIMDIRSEMASE